MDRFDWGLAEVFLEVLETGSLSAAARGLKSSQPTVGRQIRTLEAQLNTTLFTRTGKELVPTPIALSLGEHARSLRDTAAAMSLTASGHAQTLKGTVRITASEVMATYVMPAIIARLLRDQDELEIELVASNSTDNLALREADIAVRMHRPEQGDLIAKKVGGLAIGLFAHEKYLETYGHPRALIDLKNHVFLGYDTSDLMIKGINAFGLDITRHDFRMRTDNQVTYAEAIAAGVGIGATAAVAMKNREGVIEVIPQASIPALPVWLAAHQELKTSALVRHVFDQLSEELKEVCVQ